MTSLLGDDKQSTEQYALFKNKVDLFKDFSQKLILTVLLNLFRTLRTHCISQGYLGTLEGSTTYLTVAVHFHQRIQKDY
jgi:hypothetical protein